MPLNPAIINALHVTDCFSTFAYLFAVCVCDSCVCNIEDIFVDKRNVLYTWLIVFVECHREIGLIFFKNTLNTDSDEYAAMFCDYVDTHFL